MKITIKDAIKENQERIGNLAYGTIVDAPSGGSCLYMKVNKRTGPSVNHTKGYCVLLNLNHGTLREIKGDIVVTVYDGELNVVKDKAYRHVK